MIARPDRGTLLAAVVVPIMAACASGIHVARMGEPTLLPAADSASPCERQAWVEFVPSRGWASSSESFTSYPWVTYRTVSEQAPGYGVYRLGAKEPEALTSVLPRMNEPQLTRLHMQRIERIQGRQRKSNTLMLGGAAIALGAAVGAGVAGSAGSDAAGSLSILALVGLGVELWGVASMPSADERTFAGIRKYLLLPGEDNFAAAAHGVTFMNQATRTHCRNSATLR